MGVANYLEYDIMLLSWTNIHNKTKARWRKPEGKLNFRIPVQRTDGWCESAGDRKCSTFQAAGESRKGKPFTAVQEVRIFSGNLGGNAGIILVPVYYWGEIFYCKKFDPKETKFFKEVLKC